MKHSIYLAVFGLSTVVASSYGQGYVVFSSYIANGAVGAVTTYYGGSLLGTPFQAQLYYAFGAVSDPVNEYSFSSTSSEVSSAFTLYTGPNATAAYDNSGNAVGAAGLGYFDGGVAVIPGYTGGPITFEVVAFNGSSYDDSPIRGRSGSFMMDSIGSQLPFAFGDNGQPMPNFVVGLPEPTTLALAGLGGLVSFITFRRKQS